MNQSEELSEGFLQLLGHVLANRSDVVVLGCALTLAVVFGYALLKRARHISVELLGHASADSLLPKLGLVVEQSPNMMLITDVTGNIQYVNQAFIDVTGYASEEIMGKNPRILQSGKTSAATYVAMWDCLSRGRVWKGEFINQRKDGMRFFAHAVISPLVGAEGVITHYVAVINEITEFGKTEPGLGFQSADLESLLDARTRELVRQNVLLEDLLSTMPCGVFGLKQIRACSPSQSGMGDVFADYELQVANKTCQQMLGLDREAMEARHFGLVQRIHPEERQNFIARFEDGLAKHRPIEWEGRVCVNNLEHWMRIEAIPRPLDGELLVSGIVQDINQRKQQSVLLHRGAIDASPDAFVVFDEMDKITEWSPQAERLFGYRAEDILGRSGTKTILSLTSAKHYHEKIFQQDGSEKDLVMGKPYRMTAKNRDGYEFPVELQTTSIFVDQHWRFSNFIRDISDIVLAEEQLIQAQKLEAIGQLTGGLAHDFNNILGIIIGNLDLMALMEIGDEARQMLNTAISATHRGAEITESLLSLARRKSLQPVVKNLNDLIEELRPLLQQSAGKQIKLVIAPYARDAQVLMDASGFNTALLNAVINAHDAMPKGGSMTIYSYSTLIDETSAKGLGVKPGSYVVVGIDDTGTGMSKALIKRAFDPFFTTKGHTGRGTGLGLAMVWGFCRQTGGVARIESILGRGTSLQLILPLYQASPDMDKAIGSKFQGSASMGSERVLLVAGEIELSNILQSWLQDYGYIVDLAEASESALGLLERQRFDLLITDVMVSGDRQGISLAEQVAELQPKLPIILLNGGLIDPEVNPALLKWPSLDKPISRERLYDKLNLLSKQPNFNPFF